MQILSIRSIHYSFICRRDIEVVVSLSGSDHQIAFLSMYAKFVVPERYMQSKYTIGVAPIMQYTQVHNKNDNTQGNSPNVVKLRFHTLGNCS